MVSSRWIGVKQVWVKLFSASGVYQHPCASTKFFVWGRTALPAALLGDGAHQVLASMCSACFLLPVLSIMKRGCPWQYDLHICKQDTAEEVE